MKLRAYVKKYTGNTKHTIGMIVDDKQTNVHELPRPVYVEIVKHDSLFFLNRYDVAGVCIADTCHESLSNAMDQAEFEYSISKEDWGKEDGRYAQ